MEDIWIEKNEVFPLPTLEKYSSRLGKGRNNAGEFMRTEFCGPERENGPIPFFSGIIPGGGMRAVALSRAENGPSSVDRAQER